MQATSVPGCASKRNRLLNECITLIARDLFDESIACFESPLTGGTRAYGAVHRATVFLQALATCRKGFIWLDEKMFPTARNKIKKIVNSIQKEGLDGYLCRLYDLGEFRHYARRLLMWHQLSRSHICLFGRSLVLPSRWRGIKEELLLYGVHEPCATKIYMDWLEPGDTILDIGTNIGYYALVADHILGGEGSIHGFEPDPELYELAQRNYQQLQLVNVINRVAVSDRNGEVTFYSSAVSNWGSILNRKELQPTATLKVTSLTIDQYCIANDVEPTVLRMDIEGGEYLALKGARQILAKRPKIFMELHCMFLSEAELDELFSGLYDSGYTTAIWVNRYYDNAWSTQNAHAKSVHAGTLKELAAIAKSNCFPVMGIFIK